MRAKGKQRPSAIIERTWFTGMSTLRGRHEAQWIPANRSEEESATAINLAITLAQAGRKVVIVETDLRRPKARAYLGVESGLGLTDVLAGNNPPDTNELLGNKQFERVNKSLRIDANWLHPVTGRAIVSNDAGGAKLEVRFGKTTREQLVSSVAALDEVGARPLGKVVNFVLTGRRGYGYKYGYKYGYGDTRMKPEQKSMPVSKRVAVCGLGCIGLRVIMIIFFSSLSPSFQE